MHLREGTKERPLVYGVEFIGNKHVEDADLAAAVQSQATSPLPFTQPMLFEADVALRDMERIERAYRARGFYQADVRAWRLAHSKTSSRRVSLGFVIDEGPRTRVREMVISGIEHLSEKERKDIARDLPLQIGEVVTELAYDETKRILRDRLRGRGFAFADVEGEVRVHPEMGAAHVTFATEPGERYRFGDIKIEGNDKVADTPILWAASMLEEGDRYDEAAIEEAQGDVYDLGVFRAVSIDILDPQAGTKRLPVIITVQEAPLQAVELGVGGGADQASQRARTRATYRHKNLFGGLDLVETTVRGGWAVVPGLVDPFHDGPIWGAETSLRRPNFIRRNHVLGIRATYDHEVEAAYDVDSARATAGVDRDRGWYGVGAAYGLELYRISALRVAPPELDAQRSARPDRCDEPCTISFVEPRAWIDRRDDVIEPKHGWHASLRMEKGGGDVLGGTHEYIKASPEIRGYATPRIGAERFTFAARSRLGWLFPQSGPSPAVRRFFSGGPDSHRGYAVRRLSPMVEGRDGSTVPIGADHLVEGSFETRFHVTGNFSGAAFVDAGQTGFDREETFRPKNYAWAIGPGIRYRTPIGPVRFDVGYRVWAPEQRTIDGSNKRVDDVPWAFHLDIGEAF